MTILYYVLMIMRHFCTIRILLYGYFVLLVSKINKYDIKILFNIDIGYNTEIV